MHVLRQEAFVLVRSVRPAPACFLVLQRVEEIREEEDQEDAPSQEARSLPAITQRSLLFALRGVLPMQLSLLRVSQRESFDEQRATDLAQETCVLFGRARYLRHQIGEPFQHLVGCLHWPLLPSCPCALHQPISRWCENPWSALQQPSRWTQALPRQLSRLSK